MQNESEIVPMCQTTALCVRRSIVALVWILASGLSGLAEDDAPAPIRAGKYSLRLQTSAVPEHQRDISVPVVIAEPKRSENTWEFELVTDKEWGNPFKARGVIADSRIKIGFTMPERDTLITHIFLGKIAGDGATGGEFTCFVDAGKAFDGKWTLSKREKAAATTDDEKGN
jgi:hypothetical protein